MEIQVSDHTIISMPRSGWSRSSIAKLYWDGQAQPAMGPKSRERWLSQKYRMKSYAINCPISLWVKSALPLSTCYPREGVLDSIWHVRLVPMDPYYRPIAWSKCLIHGSCQWGLRYFIIIYFIYTIILPLWRCGSVCIFPHIQSEGCGLL